MNVTYNFDIESLICNQTVPDKPDYVTDVLINLVATDADSGLTSGVRGSVRIPDTQNTVVDPDQMTTSTSVVTQTFIPFAELSQITVNGWVVNSIGYAHMCSMAYQDIQERISPSQIEKSPPWNNITTSTNSTTTVLSTGTVGGN